MKGLLRRRRHALSPLLALALVTACSGGAPQPTAEREGAPRRGGTLVMGSISDVQSWNEYLARHTFAHGLLRRIYLQLARELPARAGDEPGFAPELAESWERSPDGLTWTFRLREASWSDGRPITADDVRYTWQAQTSPEVAWANASPAKDRIRDVEVLDPRTVAFHFDRDYPYQLADAVTGGILPRHVFARVPFADWRTHDWSVTPAVSGPFMLERHRPGEEIVLTRNPRYLEPELPWVDRVVVRVVPDAANLLTQLMAGSIDFIDNIPPWDAERVSEAPGLKLLPYQPPGYDHIGWNSRRAPFDDPRVRRAMTLAIDRDALVEELLYGFGRVSAGPVPRSTWAADPTLAPWPHDPETARRLLAECGFRPGPDGVLQRDGRPLAFTLLTNAGNARREAATIKVQEQLRRIGVEVEIRPLEFGTFIHRCESGDFDAYLGGFTHTERDLPLLFASASIPPAAGQNFVGFDSPVLDRLLDAMEREHDRRALRDTLNAIQAEIHDGQPYTFLYETQRLAAGGPRLGGARIDRPDDPLALLERAWISP